jgi:hypothetical protein
VITGGVLALMAFKKSDGAVAGTPDASSARGLALGADVALFTGAALGATGLILLVLGASDDREEPLTTVTPVAGVGFGGLSISGSF